MSDNFEDFFARYSIFCLASKVCPLKSVKKYLNGTELSCPVEAIRPEHWGFLLTALCVDNTLTKVHFYSCLPLHTEDKMNSKKKKRKSNRGFPTPYGRTSENISNICQSVAGLLHSSGKLKSLQLENLPIQLRDAEHLSQGLKLSRVTELSFAGCLFAANAVKTICSQLSYVPVEWINFNSCHLSPEDLLAVNDLLLAHKTRRSSEIFKATLRYQTADFDSFEGLKRISLGDNDITDHGISKLVQTLEDDHWIQALDLYRCGINNEGGKLLLEICKRQSEIQLIDLRFSDIDEVLLRRIDHQLHLNRSGKQNEYKILPIWMSPRMVYPKVLAKKKIAKKQPPVMQIVRVVENPGVDYSNMSFFPKSPTKSDAGCQTDPCDDSLCDELIIGEAKKMRKSLLGELKVRRYLTQEIEKYMHENKHLRNELRRLSEHCGTVVLDKDTYLDIRRTFEKFKKFLDIMKDYGLWDFVRLLGINEEAEIVLIQDDPESKMQVKVIEQKLDAADNPAGPFSCIKLSKLAKKGPEPEPEKFCQCQKQDKRQMPSDHHAQCQTTAGYATPPPCTRPAQAEAKQQIKTNVNSADKGSILKMFKELREKSNGKESVPNQNQKPETKRKHNSGPEYNHCKDCPKCHICIKQLPPSSIPEKLRHFKCPAEFIKVVKSELEKCPHKLFQPNNRRNVPGSCQKPNPFTQGPVTTSKEDKKKAEEMIQKKYGQELSLSGEKLEKILTEKAATVVAARAGRSNSIDLGQSNINPRLRKKKLSEESISGVDHCGSVPSCNPSVVSNQSLKRPCDSSQSEKNVTDLEFSQETSHRIFLNPQMFTEEDIAEIKDLTMRGLPVLSNSESSLSDRSSSSQEQLASTGRSHSNSSSEKSLTNQNQKSKSKGSFKNSSSGETLRNEQQVSKSYLETVSDDSTSKDAKSFSEIAVSSNTSSGKKSDPKQANSASHKQSVPSKNANHSSSSSGKRNSKASKNDSSKHSNKSSKNEPPRNSVKELANKAKVTSQKLEQKEKDDSSVPSLSDITSVSSRAINTDSIMHQISE